MNRCSRRLLAAAAVIAALLAMGSCSPDDDAAGVAATPTEPVEVRLLALGDSYTIGEAVAPDKRWPEQLAVALREKGVDVVDITYLARTGWTTADLQRVVDQFRDGRHNDDAPFEIVTLQIGVNNQFAGFAVDDYTPDFEQLLNDAIALGAAGAGSVIVLSIPDYGVTPVGRLYGAERIRLEIDLYNLANREVSETYGVRYVDITPISRLAESDPSLVARDGLHPSGKMYAKWVNLMLPVVVDATRVTARSSR